MVSRTCFAVLCCLFSIAVFAQDIKVSNTAVDAKKKGYYQWTLFIDTDPATLNTIDHVEYLLDPSFSNPQVTSADRKSNFSYTSTGWAEFEVKVKVVFNIRGKPAKYISYWLKLGKTLTIKKRPVNTGSVLHETELFHLSFNSPEPTEMTVQTIAEEPTSPGKG